MTEDHRPVCENRPRRRHRARPGPAVRRSSRRPRGGLRSPTSGRRASARRHPVSSLAGVGPAIRGYGPTSQRRVTGFDLDIDGVSDQIGVRAAARRLDLFLAPHRSSIFFQPNSSSSTSGRASSRKASKRLAPRVSRQPSSDLLDVTDRSDQGHWRLFLNMAAVLSILSTLSLVVRAPNASSM